MCECVWRYEAALLFLGQLLVTQEWLIGNGCCHSPAVAPGDGCAVKNAHTLTFSLWKHTKTKIKTHMNVCSCWFTYTKESFIVPIQCYNFWQALWRQSSIQPMVQPQVTNRQVNFQIWLSNHIKCSPVIFYHFLPCPVLHFCVLWKQNQTLIAVPLFLPPEHSGSREVHPGSNEPHARPECLLQPIPWDGLRQA